MGNLNFTLALCPNILGFTFVREDRYVKRIGGYIPWFETKKNWQKRWFSWLLGIFWHRNDPFSTMQKEYFFSNSASQKMKQIGSGFCMIPNCMPWDTIKHEKQLLWWLSSSFLEAYQKIEGVSSEICIFGSPSHFP